MSRHEWTLRVIGVSPQVPVCSTPHSTASPKSVPLCHLISSMIHWMMEVVGKATSRRNSCPGCARCCGSPRAQAKETSTSWSACNTVSTCSQVSRKVSWEGRQWLGSPWPTPRHPHVILRTLQGLLSGKTSWIEGSLNANGYWGQRAPIRRPPEDLQHNPHLAAIWAAALKGPSLPGEGRTPLEGATPHWRPEPTRSRWVHQRVPSNLPRTPSISRSNLQI